MTLIETAPPAVALATRPAGERAAEFFERRGRTVFHGVGAWWASVDVGSRFYLSCSEHLVLPADPRAVSAALARQGGIAAQFASSLPGCPSGVFLMDDPDYCIDHVQKRMRNLVRKGLAHFEIRPVEKHELLDRGIAINIETMTRHELFREEFSDPAQWRRNVEAIYGMDGTICMGAFDRGLLMGYVFGVIDDGVYFMMVQKTADAALEQHANPALIFESCRAAFASGSVRAISLGTMPFLNSPNLHQFKTRIGFSLRPYNMRIQLHSALEPFTSSRLVSLAARYGHVLPAIGPKIERQAKLLELGKGYVTPAPAAEVSDARD